MCSLKELPVPRHVCSLKALALLAALCATMPATNAIPSSPIATTPMRMGITAAPAPQPLRALNLRGGKGKSVEPPAPPPRSSLPFLLRIASMLSMYALACWMEHFFAAQVSVPCCYRLLSNVRAWSHHPLGLVTWLTGRCSPGTSLAY